MRSNKKIASHSEKHILYISVGAKEHFYTLRKMVIDRSGSSWDDYICNLATSREEAITKAQECFSKIKKHLSNHDIDLSLSLEPEFNTSQYFKSRKALSDDRLKAIENGITPIGRYNGFKISELPDTYVLWLADKFTGRAITDHDRTFQALASAGLGLALERNLFDKPQEENKAVCHIGEVGQRVNFKAEITKYEVSLSFYGNMLSYTLKVDGKTVKYRGSKYLGAVGDQVTLKATIDEHLTLDNGFKLTFIKRPTLCV